MADNETKTKEKDEEEAAEELGMSESSPLARSDQPAEAPAESHAEGEEGVAATQLGEKRFVYAAYMTGAIGVAFLMTKVLHGVWLKLALWKPALGEPRDDVLMALSGIVGVAAAFYYWRRTRARQLAEEVAQELSKVTWPTKKEVTNSTTVVIITTAVATVFFALMDRFWGFVTNFVYGI